MSSGLLFNKRTSLAMSKRTHDQHVNVKKRNRMKPICTFLCLVLVAPHTELLAQQAMPSGVKGGANEPPELSLSQAAISPQPFGVDKQTLARIHRRLQSVDPLAKALSNRRGIPPLQSPFSPPNGSVVDEVVIGAVGTAMLGAVFGLMAGANDPDCGLEGDSSKCHPLQAIGLGTALWAGFGALGGLVVGLLKER